MYYGNICEVSELIGRTLSSISVSDDKSEIAIACTDGSEYKMYHQQDCCESVSVEDVCGDLADLLGSPLVEAEEVTSDTDPEDYPKREYPAESLTWTFYKFRTSKGAVTIRWLGESNGCYSESVSLVRAAQPSSGSQS